MKRPARRNDFNSHTWIHTECGKTLSSGYDKHGGCLRRFLFCDPCGRKWKIDRVLGMSDEELAVHFEVDVDPDSLPTIRLAEVESGSEVYTVAVEV